MITTFGNVFNSFICTVPLQYYISHPLSFFPNPLFLFLLPHFIPSHSSAYPFHLCPSFFPFLSFPIPFCSSFFPFLSPHLPLPISSCSACLSYHLTMQLTDPLPYTHTDTLSILHFIPPTSLYYILTIYHMSMARFILAAESVHPRFLLCMIKKEYVSGLGYCEGTMFVHWSLRSC